MLIFYICIYILYVSTRTDLYLKYDRVWTRAGWRLTRARLRAVRGHLPVARECLIHRGRLLELRKILVSLYTLSGEVIDHDHLDRTLWRVHPYPSHSNLRSKFECFRRRQWNYRPRKSFLHVARLGGAKLVKQLSSKSFVYISAPLPLPKIHVGSTCPSA